MSAAPAESAPLLVSVSGIRGIVGRSLTPWVVADFAASYGSTRVGKPIVVSRDGRSTGDMLRHAAISGLLSVGCEVVDIGIAATPTCAYYLKSIGAGGAIQITASHNPPEWNGLKLYRPEGFVLSPSDGSIVAERYRQRQWKNVDWPDVPKVRQVADPHRPHLDKVLSLVDLEAIRARRFRVAFDPNHGSGAVFGPRLLQELGCEVSVLGGEPDGRFEHPPEPTEANLAGFSRSVRERGADIGFAVDPDADRLAIVDRNGHYIGEEYTLALAIKHRVAQQTGPVVINCSTSRISADVAHAAGCEVFLTKVGEVHVGERMQRVNAVIGGEGNGGVIDPRVGLGRDSAIGMALILDLIAKSGRSLEEIMQEMPVYAIRKDKFPVQPAKLPSLLQQFKERFHDGRIDEADGVRIDWPDAWVQVRASNTEPIIRVIAEAKDAARAEALCREVGSLVG